VDLGCAICRKQADAIPFYPYCAKPMDTFSGDPFSTHTNESRANLSQDEIVCDGRILDDEARTF
jgi:hypothetical protein